MIKPIVKDIGIYCWQPYCTYDKSSYTK